MSDWRRKNYDKLSNEIQHRIRLIQSPPMRHCKYIEKIHCSLQTDLIGFGNQIFLLIKCLLTGYFTGTLSVITNLLDNYLNNSTLKWDHFLTPISKTCQPNASVSYPQKESDFNKTCDGWFISKFL
jgi:hypothetical protein